MIVIGAQDGERIEIQKISKVSRHESFQTKVLINSGGFSGSITPYVELRDFVDFLNELEALYTRLTGTAELSHLEGQFYLKMSGDGKGHIEIEGVAFSKATFGTRLEYEFQIDQTHIPKTIKSIKHLLNEVGK